MGFVSRAGQKLEHAIGTFGVDVGGLVCADLGSNTGGFVDCLLGRGAVKVYAIDTGYGVLDYRLRKDPRVVVMERTNAMHAQLPEAVQFISIDVAWTKQKHILPAAGRMLARGGRVITLIKPHYEAQASMLRKGVLMPEALEQVIVLVKQDIAAAGFELLGLTDSPILGAKGNREMLALLMPQVQGVV
jgi:23S rRNA (cytidine1920-2'-O)/16S rRNA (cytidine1409-2'-O)-methyltransferase